MLVLRFTRFDPFRKFALSSGTSIDYYNDEGSSPRSLRNTVQRPARNPLENRPLNRPLFPSRRALIQGTVELNDGGERVAATELGTDKVTILAKRLA